MTRTAAARMRTMLPPLLLSCFLSLSHIIISASAVNPPLVTRALQLLTPASDRSIWQFNGATTPAAPAHYSLYTPPSVLPPPPAQYYPSSFHVATLNGYDHYVDLGAPVQDGGSRPLTVPASSGWTFVTWLWTDSLTTSIPTLTSRVLLSRTTGLNDSLQILIGSSGQIHSFIKDQGKVCVVYFGSALTTTVEPLTLRQWIHIGVSYDVTDGFSGYLGGRRIGNCIPPGPFLGRLETSYIGKSETQMTSQYSPFQGSLYATAWFDYLLPLADRLALAAPQTSSSLLSLTPFIYPNQKTALTIRDNKYGVLSNTITPWKDYDAITFITNKLLDLSLETPAPTYPNIQLFANTPFTISFFLKMTAGWATGSTVWFCRNTNTGDYMQLQIFSNGNPATAGLWFNSNGPIGKPLAVGATTNRYWYDQAQTRNFSQTEWNRITMTYDGGPNLKFYINDLISLALTSPLTPKLIASNYNTMYLGTEGNVADLQAQIAQFTIWPGLELNQTEVAALILPYQVEYTHDAPTTVQAGTTVFITITASLNSGNTTLIIRGGGVPGDTSATPLVYQQRFDSVKGYFAGFSFLIPSTWSRSTYTITFDAPVPDPLQILPQPICMEVIAPADSSSVIDTSLTVLSMSEFLSTSDWNLPLTNPFNVATGCYLELGPTQVPTERILTCPGTGAGAQYIDLTAPLYSNTLPFPGVNVNPSSFTFSFHLLVTRTTFAWLFRLNSTTAADGSPGSEFITWNIEPAGATTVMIHFYYTKRQGNIIGVSTPLNLGQWYHILLTCNEKQCRLWKDGFGLYIIGLGSQQTPFARFTQQTMMGQPGDTTTVFPGSIASFYFWNRGLTPREITFLVANKPASLQLPSEHVERVAVLRLPSSSQLLSQAAFIHKFDRASASTHGTLIPAPSGAPGYHVLSLFAQQQSTFDLFSKDDIVGPVYPNDPLGSSILSATWSLWFSSDTVGGSPGTILVLSNSNRSSYLQLTPDSYFTLTIGTSTCGTNYTISNEYPFGPNIITLVTAVWNGPDAECYFYINNKKVGQGYATGNMTGFTSGGFIPTQAYIGGFPGTSSFKGNLAHFAYWRRALTGQEIGALARNPPLNVAIPSAARLTAAEAILASADYDYIPRRQSSATVPYVLADVNQPQGAGVLQYSGLVGAYTDLGDHRASQTGLTYGFPDIRSGTVTISIWIMLTPPLTSVIPGTGIFHISNSDVSIAIQHGPTGQPGDVHFFFSIYDVPQSCTLQFSDPSAPASTTGPLQLNKWYHLVGTFDGQGKSRAYVNGLLAATKIPRPTINPLMYYILDATNRDNVYLGTNNTKASMFTGMIAQVSVWDRALDEAEVPVLFTKPPPSIARLVNPSASLPVLDPSRPPLTSSEWLFDTPGANYVNVPNGGAELVGDNSSAFVDLLNPLDNPTTKQILPLMFGGESVSFSFWLNYFDSEWPLPATGAPVFECSTTSAGTGTRGDNLLSLFVLPQQIYQLNTTSNLFPTISKPFEYSIVSPPGSFRVTQTYWHHVTIVYDSDTEQQLLYINGAIAASTHWLNRITQMPPRAIRQQCYIGKSRSSSSRQSMRVGYFGFYNSVALRPAQVRSLYQHPPLQLSVIDYSIAALGTPLDRLLSSSLGSFTWKSITPSASSAPPSLYPGGGGLLFNNAGTGQYIFLDQTNDVGEKPLSLSDINNIKQDGLTFSFWLKFQNNIHQMEMIHWYIDASGVTGLFIKLGPIRWQVDMKINGALTCSVFLDGWTLNDYTYFHHHTIVLGRDNTVLLYVDGSLRPNTISFMDTCGYFTSNWATGLTLPYFSANSPTAKVTFGGSPLVNGATSYGFAGRVGMINVFSRALTPPEIRLLASNVPNPATMPTSPATPPASAPINSAATASYSWKFAVSSSRPGGYTLQPSPSGIGFIGRLNQTYINLTSDNPLSTPLPVRIGDGQFAFSCWLKVNNFFATTGGDSLLELRPSTGSNNWIRLLLVSSSGSSTYGHKLQLVVSDSVGTQVYSLTTVTVILKERWNHIVFVIANAPTKVATIYLNGAVVVSKSGTNSVSVADRPIAMFAYNPDTGKSLMDLEVADISIWDNSAFISMTPDVVLSLYRTPPSQLAGTLGSEIDRLLMSAAGRYDCASPPGSTSLVTWMPGASPNSAYCRFNNDTGIYSSFLNISTIMDNPTATMIPGYLTTVLSTIGQGITSLGLSFSFHIRPSSYPAVGVRRTLLSCSPEIGDLTNKIQISFENDPVKGILFTFNMWDASGNPLPNMNAHLPAMNLLPLNQPIHLALVITTPLAGQTTIYFYYNNAYSGSTFMSNPILPVARSCIFGRDTIDMAGKPSTVSSFQGDLGLFTVFTRAITLPEIALLASYVPSSFAAPATFSFATINMNMAGYGQAVKVSSSSPLTCYARPPSKNQVTFQSSSEGGESIPSQCQQVDTIDASNTTLTSLTCSPPIEVTQPSSAMMFTSSAFDYMNANTLLFSSSHISPTFTPSFPVISTLAFQATGNYGTVSVTFPDTFRQDRYNYSSNPLSINCYNLLLTFTIPPDESATFKYGALTVPSNPGDTFTFFGIAPGSNTITMSLLHTQGIYSFTIINPEPPVAGSPVTAFSIVSITPAHSPLTLQPMPYSPTTDTYTLSIPMDVTALSFRISLSTGVSVYFYLGADSAILIASNTTMSVNLIPGSPIDLKFTIVATEETIFTVHVVPTATFITTLSTSLHQTNYDQPLTITPALSTSTRTYTILSGESFTSIWFHFTVLPSDSVTFTLAGNQPQVVTSSQTSLRLTLLTDFVKGVWNNITIKSNIEGTYTFAYYNPRVPLLSVIVKNVDYTPQPNIPLPSLLFASPQRYSSQHPFYRLTTFDTAHNITFEIVTSTTTISYSVNSTSLANSISGTQQLSFPLQYGITNFVVKTLIGDYQVDIYATASSTRAIPFTDLNIVQTKGNESVTFDYPISVSTYFSYAQESPPQLVTLASYSLLVTCISPCQSRVTLYDGSNSGGLTAGEWPLQVGSNNITFGVLTPGYHYVAITVPTIAPFYPNYTFTLYILPAAGICLYQSCANNGTCIDQPSSTYSTPYTCYCTAAYQGATCETPVTTPYQPTYPTAVIYSSASTITDCLNLTLDGSSSYGLGPAGLHPFFAWSIASIRVQGIEIGNITDPAYNPTFAATTWSEASSSPLLNGSSVLPSTSAITFSGVKLLKGAIYTFSLRVGNDRESSTPASVQVESISTESASWTPAVGLRVPSRVTRPDFVIITSQLTPSSCAPLPNDLTSVYLWNVTMTNKLTGASSLLPDVSSIPAASRSVTSSSSNGFSIPSNFFRTGYTYIVTLDLTLTSAEIPAHRRRRLLATSSEITASSMIVPSPSPITARIVGSDRTKPIDAAFTIAADLSLDPDYVDDAAPVNSPSYSGLAFTWSCKEVVGGTPCSPQLSTGVDLTQVRVNVPSGMMSIGVTYQWTVLVTSIIDSSRSATATVRVTGSQPSLQSSSSKPPLVTILNAPIRMNSDQTLRLSASVVTQTSTSVIDMLYLWSLTCTTNSLTPPPIINNVTTTTTQLLPSLQQQSNLGSAVNSSSLVLQPNLLLVPGEYEFSVTVTDPYTTTVISALTGSATALATAVTSVTIIVNARPQPGDCSIVPSSSSSGIALETVFTLTCSNWYEPLNANFAPFTYAIAYRADNENTNGDSTYQQLTSSSLLTQRSFLLPAGALSLRTVITDQVGASSEFDLPITVQVSPSALLDLMAYIANLTYVQLPQVMAAGDSLASISFIHQIADLVNSARTQSQYQDAMSQSKLLQFNVDLLESYQQALVTTLELVQSSLDTTTLSIMTQSLIPLTQYADQLPTNVVSNVTLEVVKSLLDVGIISTHIEPGSPVKDLTLVLSNLMTTCSQLDAISHLVHESMRLRQIHAVAGESIELAALNYYAYVERTLVAAGTEIHLPTGESVILTPTAMKNYILRLNQLNISTIDTGGAMIGAAEMDTRIVTFSSRWSTCRTQSQQSTMPSISSLTNIEITFPNGDLVDIPSLDTDIVFTLPISKNSTDSILNLAREQLPCPAAPFDEMVVANTSFTCQFWNVTTRSYSSSGCHSLGVTFLPDGSTSLKCSCSHLTEFAILYAEAQNLYNTDVCAQLTDAHLGNGMYLAFLIIYSLVGLIAMIQLVRVLTLHGVKKFVFISLEHALILAMCVFRAVNQSMYYTLYKEISISKQIIISSLPYLFYSWIFTLVIVTWASIWATSARGEKNDNPLKPYKLQFFIGNIAITCAFLVIFGLMSQTTDLDSLRTLNRAGVALTCIVEMGFGLFLVVYGLLLVRALTEHFVSAYAKKLGGIAIAFSIAFGVSAAILAHSVADEDEFARHSLAYNAVYFILDIIGLLLVMFLFAKSISTASGRDKSRGDGSTTGGGGGGSSRSHNPLSSKTGNVSSAGNSRVGHSRNTSSKQFSQRDLGDVQLAPLSVQSPVSRAMVSQNSAYQPMSPSASTSKAPPPSRKHQPPSFLKNHPTIRPGSASPPPLPAAASGSASPSMRPFDDVDAARPSSSADTIPTFENQHRSSTVASSGSEIQPQRDSTIHTDEPTRASRTT